MTDVDAEAGILIAHMDDGRQHRFTPGQTGADQLAHGYAVTVHRSQEATVERAHRLEDGGGRELANVALSRGPGTVHRLRRRRRLGPGLEDLHRDWSAERRPRWAIDTGTPTTDPAEIQADTRSLQPLRTALRQARLRAERDALVAVLPVDPAITRPSPT